GSDGSRRGSAAAEQARLLLRETRDREARELAERRAIEEELGTVTARRSALDALERDGVGIAPATAALMAARSRYGDRIIGTIADQIGTDTEQAAVAEQLLGDFIHAVLVRDEATVDEIREWHQREKPGTLVLLPVNPGPRGDTSPVDSRLQVRDVAVPWVAALIGGARPLEQGHGVRRADGSVWLTGPAPSAGPLRRRSELKSLQQRLEKLSADFEAAEARLEATRTSL